MPADAVDAGRLLRWSRNSLVPLAIAGWVALACGASFGSASGQGAPSSWVAIGMIIAVGPPVITALWTVLHTGSSRTTAFLVVLTIMWLYSTLVLAMTSLGIDIECHLSDGACPAGTEQQARMLMTTAGALFFAAPAAASLVAFQAKRAWAGQAFAVFGVVSGVVVAVLSVSS